MMQITSLLNRKVRDRNRKQRPSQRSRSRLLRFESMEVRALLAADFGLSGGTLTLDNFTQDASESLSVSEDGTNYRFGLSEGTWTGAMQTGLSLASGGQVLEIEKSLLSGGTIGEILVSDTAGVDFDVTFDDVNLQALQGAFALLDVGDVGQAAGSIVQFGHFDVTAASVTLAESGNDFGSVRATATAGGVTLFDAGDIVLGTPGQANTAGVSGGDYVVAAEGTITVSAGHGIDSTGTSAVNLTAGRNIALATGSSITTVDGGITLQANQQATPTAGDFIGIDVSGAAITTTGSGHVELTGRGGDDALTGSHFGIRLQNSATIESTATGATAGTITIDGTGGAGTNGNFGVWIESSGTQVSSVDGDILITGQGGDGSSRVNVGVQVSSSAVVSSTGTGAEAATITIDGTGGAGTASNYGVWIESSGAQVTSVDGDILITGQRGDGSGSSNYGVVLSSSAVVSSTGTGAEAATITIDGTGGAGTNDNVGVRIQSSGTKVTSVDGDILIAGQGGDGSGGFNHGVELSSAAVVSSTGTGAEAATITIDGTGGAGTGSNDNSGVRIQSIDASATQVSSIDGDIQIVGMAGAGDSVGIDLANQVLVTGDADVTLIADSMDLMAKSNAINAGANTVTLKTLTTSGAIGIDIGGDNTAGMLGLSNAELDRITAGLVVIGEDETPNTSTLSDDIQHAGDASFRITTARNIVLPGGTSWTSEHGNLTFSANQQATPTAGDFIGIDVSGAAITTTGSGHVELTGRGGDDALTGSHFGMRLQNSATIQSTATGATAGTITIDGTGGNGTGANDGVRIQSFGTQVTSVDGNILIAGQGGDGSGGANFGVFVIMSAVISSTGMGSDAATLTLDGNGGNGTSNNYGVRIESSGTQVTSVDGDIHIAGQGGDGSAQNNFGVSVSSALISSTGIGSDAATVTLNGTGGNGTFTNYGVEISNSGAQVTSVDGNIHIAGQGGHGSSSSNLGVLLTFSAMISSTGTSPDAATVTLDGTGGNGTYSNVGVQISGSGTRVISAVGDILIAGQGGEGSGSDNSGVSVFSSAVISSTGTGSDAATVTLDGNGGNGWSTLYGVLIQSSGTQITSVDGDILIAGQGGEGLGGANIGVRVLSSAVISSTGTGFDAATITVDGTGGAGTSHNFGVGITSFGTQVTSVDGDIQITGQGGDGSSSFNYGVQVVGSAVISSGTGVAAATITIDGTGGAGTSNNSGVSIASSVTSVDGDILIAGRGGDGSSSGNLGVQVSSAAVVSSTGIGSDAATITLVGTGGNGIADNEGVRIESSTTQVISVDGDILIAGYGGQGSAENNFGVSVSSSAVISSTGTGSEAATITIAGTGGTGTSNNFGVTIGNSGTTKVSSVDGNILISGQGGDGASSNNFGVLVSNSAVVSSTGTGSDAATITLNGTGGNGTFNNIGVWIPAAQVTSVEGSILIAGQGGDGSGSDNFGVDVGFFAVISSTGTGAEAATITIDGTGGAGTNSNLGVTIANFGTKVISVDGDILISGQGGNGSGNSNYGVRVSNSAVVSSTGTGAEAATITIDGTGGGGTSSNFGVWILGFTQVTTVDGDIQITGMASVGDSVGIDLRDQDHVLVTGEADVTLMADSMDILASNAINAGANTVTLKTLTTSGAIGIDIGGDNAASMLGLSNAELDRITAGLIVIGEDETLNTITLSDDIQHVGDAGFRITTARNIVIPSGTSWTSEQGDLTFSANQQATPTAGDFIGIDVSGAAITTTGSGHVELTGRGGDDALTGNHFGIRLQNSATIQSTATGATAGTITIDGTGGAGTFINVGVWITNPGTQVSSVDGDILITGQGGDGSGHSNYGMQLSIAAVVSSTGTGAEAATIMIDSSGGAGTHSNFGVQMVSSGTQVTSVDGDILITGQGDDGSGGSNHGVQMFGSAVVSSTGTGGEAATITIDGTGGAGTGSGRGVRIESSGTQITSVDGDILISGQGGGGSGSFHHGVELSNSAVVSSTGTGTAAATITIDGTGGAGTGSNWGVWINSSGTQVRSVDGDILITGQGGGGSSNDYGVQVSGSAVVSSTGTGDEAATITIDGNGGAGTNRNVGVRLVSSGTQVTSVDGDILITGQGGDGSGHSSSGVELSNSAVVSSTGTGAEAATITIDGNGGGGWNTNWGLLIFTSGTLVTSIDGDILISGTAGMGDSVGIDLRDQDHVLVTGEADVTLMADSMDILAGNAINAGANTVTLKTLTTSGAVGIDIGGDNTAGMLGLSNAELNRITAGLIIIGEDATPNTVTLSDDIQHAGDAGFRITTARNIVLPGGTSWTSEHGALTFSANQDATATSGGFIGVEVNNAVVSSNSGAILLQGRGGDAGGQQYGVHIHSGGAVGLGTIGPVTVEGTGGASSDSNNHGVWVSGIGSQITSGGGDVLVEGTGGGKETSGFNYGVVASGNGVITSAGQVANVTVNGYGGNKSGTGGNVNYGVQVSTNAAIMSSGGAVLVEGTGGGAGSSGSNHGLFVRSGGSIYSAGTADTATVEVKGYGGNASQAAASHGVFITGNTSLITSSGGEVLVEGTGAGTGAFRDNHGVLITSAGSIASSGTDSTSTVTVRGFGGFLGKHGVNISGTNSVITSAGGEVLVEGTGGGSGVAVGVYVGSQASITSDGDESTVTVYGQGGDGDGTTNNHGVRVDGTNAIITSSGGAVLVEGVGGGGNSSSNYGVYVAAGRLSSGGVGMVSVAGLGGPGSGGDNHGVYVQTGEITSGGGDVMISGTGSENAESPLRSNGVEVGGSLISAGGLGNVTITGVGGAGLAQRNYGVYVRSVAVITSGGGDVSVWGRGGDGNSSLNYGVMTTGDAEITSGGSGNVAVTGIGGKGAGSNNVGLYLSPSMITSGGAGTVTVLGQGGGNADSGGGNRGIWMSSAVITSGGIGQVTVSGFGGTGPVGSNDGVFFSPGTANGVDSGDTVRITSGGGNVHVLGHAGEGPTNQRRAIDLGAGSGGGIIASGNNADITITTDGLWASSTAEVVIDSGTGKTTLRPYSSGTLINLGGPSSAATSPPTLGFTAEVMEKFIAGTLVIGDTDSGTLAVTADISRSAATDIQLISGGDIVISGGSIDTGGGTLLLHAGDSPAAVRPTRSGTDVTASTLTLAGDLAIGIDGTAVDIDYTQLSVVGMVDLTGVDLVLTGSYSPVNGDAFTVVSATGVSGQFNGLADDDQVMLGGQSLTIQYSSTDVTLNVIAELNTTHVTLDGSGNLLVTDTATSGKNDDLRILFDGSSYTIEDLTGHPIEIVGVAGSSGSGTASVTIPKTSITGTKIIFNVLDGDDLLSVDAGTPGEHTIEYHGGGGSNALNLVGGTIHTSSYTYASATDGSIALDPDGPGASAPWTISYTGLTPLTSNITSDVVELVYAGGSETISVSDAGSGQTTVASTLGATTTFVNPTALLVIQTTSGSDVINVDSLGTGYASLHIEGDDTGDVVNFNGPLTFAADHSLTVLDVGVISLPNTTSDLATRGTGTVHLAALKNIALSSGSSITTVDGGITLEANQQDTPTGGNFSGIEIDNATIGNTSGAITLTGRGGDGPGQQYGVSIHSGATVGAGTNGAVTIIGKGGNTTGDEGNASQGVRVVNAMIGSGGGDISVTGTGGGSGTSANNYGVFLVSGGEITAGGTGSVVVVGSGGNTSGAGGSLNHGVFVQSSNSRIHAGGDVSVTGTNAGIGSNNFGVSVSSGGEITANGTGNVTVEGSGSIGVSVFNANSLITSAGGQVSVSGDGSGVGVRVQQAGQITAEGAGSVTVQGSGGGGGGSSAHGVSVSGSGSQIIAGDGGVNVIGTAGGESGAHGFIVRDSGELNTTGAGTISITADRIHLGSSVNAGANAVTLVPETSGTTIGLGSADASGRLGLTDDELDRVTAGVLRIGSENAGAISITQAINPAGTDILHLFTGGTVDAGDTGAIAVEQLAVSSVGSVSLKNWALGNSAQLLAAATTGPGSGIHFENDGALAIGTVDGLSGISVNGGGIAIITHSPLTVNQGVVDVGGGNITLTATNDGGDDDHLTINASVQASGGSGNIELNAGTNLILGGGTTVSATGNGTISATATQTTELSTQATLSTEGGEITLQTQDVVISGTDSNDEISLQPSGDDGGVELTINGVSLVFTPIADGEQIGVETVTSDGSPNTAPLVDAGANRSVKEGERVHFSGSFTDADAGDTHTIVWDFGDGSGAVVGTLTPEHSYADNGTYTVSLAVTDRGGLRSMDTLTVTVTNVPPTATIFNDGPLTYGQSVTVGFIDPFDPSPDDTAAGFRYSFGLAISDLANTYLDADGSSLWSSELAAGTYTVYGRIFDKDNGYNQYDTAVIVEKAMLTVTADDQNKIYGEADPALTYRITEGSLAFTDAFFGDLARAAGEDVGSYAIEQGSLALSDNYDLSFVEAELKITHAILTGDATTQDALNLAKQGLFQITVANIGGFVNGENSDVFLTAATFWITIEGTKYEFEPTSVEKLSDSSISISYKLKNSDLHEDLAEALEEATSGATAIEAGFAMESMNYSLSDDDLTRLFSTIK